MTNFDGELSRKGGPRRRDGPRYIILLSGSYHRTSRQLVTNCYKFSYSPLNMVQIGIFHAKFVPNFSTVGDRLRNVRSGTVLWVSGYPTIPCS